MSKAIVFALLFVLAGVVMLLFIAPFAFHTRADCQRFAAVALPIIFVAGGGAGFAFGWRRSKR
jgi:NADH:ubiquinone oxidoreductase subunit 3 (subunit A)